ncbi:MFS/sugar transport protein [Sarocladium implicatum]|nr:MFS/sugar transport protein [Sarocladium implicatum]
MAGLSPASPAVASRDGESTQGDSSERIDERSPLLSSSPNDSPDEQPQRGAVADSSQETKSVWYLILLTISIGGLQIAWSVEMSNGSPFLLSLGLSKSLMALVWIAGPLTGTLVQPYVGMLSDNCRIPWGRRKPFMVGGTAATILSLLFLAWVQDIVGGILGLFGVDRESQGVKVAIIVAAVFGVYVLDFAINALQAAIRAFIVDCAPAHQQEAANAMASRIIGFGNIVGYVAGYVNLSSFLWFLGNTQFKILCAIASIGLFVTVGVSVAIIPERDPRLDGPPKKPQAGIISFFISIFKTIKHLPPTIKRVCMVQFCSWVGFFPLLFYTSSYIGEIYLEPYLEGNPDLSKEELDKLYERATRIGTFALLVNSIVSLTTNVFLPFFISPTYDSQPVTLGPGEVDAAPKLTEESVRRPLLEKLHIPGLTLRRAWFGGLVLFGLSMFCTVSIRSVKAATSLIGLVGVTWAMTLWAPYAIISAEISRRHAITRARKLRNMQAAETQDDANGSPSSDGLVGSTDGNDDDEQAGIILGIHNMAIAAPQIIATLGSSIIFKIWQKPRGTPGDHSMSIVFALGGLFVLSAAFFLIGMKDGGELPQDVVTTLEEGDHEPPATTNISSRRSQARAALTRNRSFGTAGP